MIPNMIKLRLASDIFRQITVYNYNSSVVV